VRSGYDRRAWDSTNYTERHNGVVYYKKIKKQHVLSVATIAKIGGIMTRTWYLKFDSDDERDEWMFAINAAADGVCKTEAGLANFVARTNHPQRSFRVMSENDIAMMVDGYIHQRQQANAPQATKEVNVMNLLGKMEANSSGGDVQSQVQKGTGFRDVEAMLAEESRILDMATKMAENSKNGVVDFAMQREYLGLVSKNSSVRMTIMAPAWAQQLMLPARAGLWIASITPVSPASFATGIEPNHDVVVAVNGLQIPHDPAIGMELVGTTRWALAERGLPCTFTLYNLKSRLFSTVVIEHNPANLPKPPMASGIMLRWIEGIPNNGIEANNEEPVVPTV
jgi:hypothetical protein